MAKSEGYFNKDGSLNELRYAVYILKRNSFSKTDAPYYMGIKTGKRGYTPHGISQKTWGKAYSKAGIIVEGEKYKGAIKNPVDQQTIRYRTAQFERLGKEYDQYKTQVKFTKTGGETNWMTIENDEMQKIIKILTSKTRK